ncbi:DUF5686 family protein [Pedobacter nutrimenti]|uniref:Carboxypeptidase family protein n=1 Tax=Pedobacter nutrimenti TaxID=1241337 RepID=A0A318ULW4_9SPHI|nr:DUF5686 family protein [Pedobacter nutrimenti]PYF70081.1 carboxypeptidase family protein [Pedobacter nutrimenti]
MRPDFLHFYFRGGGQAMLFFKHKVFCIAAGLVFMLNLLYCPALRAQEGKAVSGKVTDAQTGEAIPYATIYVKLVGGGVKATASDFDGLYRLVLPQHILTDSVYATYVSYTLARKALPRGTTPVADFQLAVNSRTLNTVTITPKTYVNPAWEIMENLVKNKPQNDMKRLKSFGYESYNRIDVSVTNLSEKIKKSKVMKQVMPIMNDLQKIAGDQGTPMLPIFASETISNYKYTNNPERKTEHVLRTKVSGVGIEDETLISQLAGSTFLQYNFYNNYLRLANKEFISPITDSWKTFYNYELTDAHDKIDGKEYYKIEFKPKRSHDLAFDGVMWITKDSYALYRIDCNVSKDANLNFLNKVRIQQAMVQPSGTSAWLPMQTRIVVNVGTTQKKLSGFIAKFYLSNKDFEVNVDYPSSTFKESLVMSPEVNRKDEKYWVSHRTDSLTAADKALFKMIDTVKNLPIVKTYADIAATLINGYYKVGKISFGPYPYTYSYNDLEGSVLRLGATTNTRFSEKLILSGFVSYGFRDTRFKYNAGVDYIFSRKPWVQAGASYQHDIGQTGYQFEQFSYNQNNVFSASIRNGSISRRGPFLQDIIKGYVQTDIFPSVKGKLTFTHRSFDPLFSFHYRDKEDNKSYDRYDVSEIQSEIQWTPGRRLLESSKINRRISIGNGGGSPIITFRYTRGVKMASGDFNYDKFHLNIMQKPPMGILGKGDYSLTAGYIPSAIPYPLLENHRFSFNTMRFLEFASDKYVSLSYTQHMEGLITNSIPLLKKLNVRTVAVLNVLEGSLSDQNNEAYVRGRTKLNRSMEGVPYVEAGYGIENILKIVRVDFLHRITHRDHLSEAGLEPSNFATRVTLQFRL